MSEYQRYYVGLDLGPTGQSTGIAVLMRPVVTVHDAPEHRRPPYALRHLHRFPIGTPYPDVLTTVREILQTPPLPGACLTIDETGVGRAVTDLFWEGLENQVTCQATRITITAGSTPSVTGRVHLPKQELVGTMQILLQTRRLVIPRGLPDAETLVRELEGFRLKPGVVETTDPLEAWRDGPHDDLVLAIALAAYVGEKHLPGLYDKPTPQPQEIQYRLW